MSVLSMPFRTSLALAFALLSALPQAARAGYDEGVQALQKHDGVTAYHELLPLAEAGEADAQNALGVLLRRGDGVPADPEQATAWQRRAAERGLLVAMSNLAAALANGQGIPKDPVEAALWETRAATAGLPKAQAQLGLWYAHGFGVPRNLETARDWLLRSARAGWVPGMFALAVFSLAPTDGIPDAALGREWLRQAADAGHKPAQALLASLMFWGEVGLQPNPAVAVGYARSAAQAGEALAEKVLGDAYATGQGIARDDAQAAQWYLRAARHGNAQAQQSYAEFELAGRGVSRNPAGAFYWASVAQPRALPANKPALDTLRDRAALEVDAAQRQMLSESAANWHRAP